jgi:starvation-inducible DNA-binding protein
MANRLFATRAQEAPIDIGVDRSDRKQLAHAISTVLADTYVLYAATQSVHWNAAGPLFYSVHKLTETQYEDMADAIDTLAERIRAIGFPAPGGLNRMVALSGMENRPEPQTTEEMIRLLIDANEHCAKTLRDAVKSAEACDDVKTADLLTERIGQHEENSWMLRALLA